MSRDFRFFLILLLLLSLLSCNTSERRSSVDPSLSNTQQDDKELKEGEKFYNFSLPDLNGQTVSLADFRGKLVLVNLWATWCAPCVAELPALQRLYQTLNGQGFEVIAISVDSEEAREDVLKLVKKKGLSVTTLLDPKLSLPPKLGVTGFPESFFVGPDGELLNFLDPDTKKNSVRIIADRPWDSPVFIEAVGNLLTKHLSNDSDSV